MAGTEMLQRSPHLIRRRSDLRDRRAVHLRRHDIGEIAVGKAASALERSVGAAAAPDRRAARLHRRWQLLNFGKRIEPALMAHLLAAPELAKDLNSFRQSRPTFLHRHSD